MTFILSVTKSLKVQHVNIKGFMKFVTIERKVKHGVITIIDV